MKIYKQKTYIRIIDRAVGNTLEYNVELFKDAKYGQSEKEAKWEINWGAYGSVGIEETKVYIKLLRKAIELAKEKKV